MTEWETATPAVAETPDIKLFGKWSTDDVQINDISLQVKELGGLGFGLGADVESSSSEKDMTPRLKSVCVFN